MRAGLVTDRVVPGFGCGAWLLLAWRLPGAPGYAPAPTVPECAPFPVWGRGCRIARLFFTVAAGDGGVAGLASGDVTGFVLACCRGRSPRWARLLVTALRSLLRFLFVEGLTPADLSGAVPNVAGEILIRGKADRHERLPLPADIGEALAGYLRRGRPRRPGRCLFLQPRAPYAPLTSHAVRAIVARAAVRAGLRSASS